LISDVKDSEEESDSCAKALRILFQMGVSGLIVDFFRKVECSPRFLSVRLSEAETAYQMTVEGSFFVFDESIMPVVYHAMIMGSIQLNESIDRDTAVGVLRVCPVELLVSHSPVRCSVGFELEDFLLSESRRH
jgi:hypothetical protein